MVDINSSSPTGVSSESAEATVSISEHPIGADEPVTKVPTKKRRNLPGMPGKKQELCPYKNEKVEEYKNYIIF